MQTAEISADALLDLIRAYNPKTNAPLIRAAYDPVMPVAASDPAHALRLAARLTAPQ